MRRLTLVSFPALSYINAIQFVLGLFLVWNARYLSRSTAVFFATGVSLGVGLWVLLVVLVVGTCC